MKYPILAAVLFTGCTSVQVTTFDRDPEQVPSRVLKVEVSATDTTRVTVDPCPAGVAKVVIIETPADRLSGFFRLNLVHPHTEEVYCRVKP